MCKYPTVEHGSKKKVDVKKVVPFEIKRNRRKDIKKWRNK